MVTESTLRILIVDDFDHETVIRNLFLSLAINQCEKRGWRASHRDSRQHEVDS